ncbi:MAG: hypothetical protein JXA96_08460 [Sedimentisphaerales bacterium]|nr:hypothetical protein [Sedimentisphaerales bacterium]
MIDRPFCFVIMPFQPELHYFYLFTHRHLEETHHLHVERGDHEVLTVPLMKKIEDQITKSDMLIADVTGNNPNVFYELGIAHNQSKPVILITQEIIEAVPVDIKPFEFIKYSLSEHTSFFDKLDSAVSSILTPRYTDLFLEASEFLQDFNRHTGISHQSLNEQEFSSRLASALNVAEIPTKSDRLLRLCFLLPKIIKDTSDIQIMARITEYTKAEHNVQEN